MIQQHLRKAFVRFVKYSLKSAILLLVTYTPVVIAQPKPITARYTPAVNAFPLAVKGIPVTLVHDPKDAEVVGVVSDAFKKDVKMITGIDLSESLVLNKNAYPVIIGTLGSSKIVDQLAKAHKIQAGLVKGKWETFCISLVKNPSPGITQALVIFGSDPRGTAFGVFELSKIIGVSPFVWWADVTPQQREALYITGTKNVVGPPSVKFRGIFINDEDWGLQPWAAKHMDTDVKDIGPKTYEKVFELMLRLKSNYLWPAMHPCTKAFWYYKDNPAVARKYDIVLGASHCEPLLRNNIFEWADNFKNEYGINPGEWRYDVNKTQIDKYWDDRVKESQHNDAVYTVGMRGIHDSGMPGPVSKVEKKNLLEQVINNQRAILKTELGKQAEDIPQIFCPYKEVLDLYRLDMKLPEDVTLAWADDNFGYVRQLSNPQEQQRSGGSGVYYHFSYWGVPLDFLWLSTISPTLTSYELTKAYQLNAKKVWIFNVGDVKPTEMEMQFAMDLAWDVNAWPPEKASKYPEYWAGETFGMEYAKEIGYIKKEYYRLAAAGKPEQLTGVNYTDEEIAKRITDYQAIADLSRSVESKIPTRLKDAYFQLIAYPVEGCLHMNEKILYARQSLTLAKAGDQKALVLAEKAQEAYSEIQRLTIKYNKEIAGGKWDGMMDYAPRDLAMFKKPKVATVDMIAKSAVSANDIKPVLVIQAADFAGVIDSRLKLINGLGIGKSALTVWPMNVKSIPDEKITSAPAIVYQVPFTTGEYTLKVRCLPTFPLYNGMPLRYAIAIDDGKPEFVNLAVLAETKPWSTNIMRGFAEGSTNFKSTITRTHRIMIFFPDPGVALSDLLITQGN